jgi:hypothetical protein
VEFGSFGLGLKGMGDRGDILGGICIMLYNPNNAQNVRLHRLVTITSNIKKAKDSSDIF